MKNVDSVRTYVRDYLRQNPKASETQVLVETKGYFQTNAKQLGISKKQISQIAPVVSEVHAQFTAEQLKANVKPVTTPTVQNAVTKINSQEAQRHYDDFHSLTRKGKQRLHKRNMQEAKSAFGGDEYIRFLEEKHPDLIEKEVPKTSNNKNKKQANAEYMSSKKKKEIKKKNEHISQELHKRYRDTKPKRNARYLTSQGQMTKEAKRIYNTLLKIQGQLERGLAPFHSAKESMQVFIENGLAPIIESKKPTATPATPVKPPTSVKPAQPVQEAVETAVETSAKNTLNTVKKSHNKTLIAIGSGIVGLGALMFGYKTYKDTDKHAS